MRIIIILIVFFFSTTITVFSQQIGFVKSGSHSLKLLKENNRFSLTYSDILSSHEVLTENTFHFTFKESIYSIIADGFKKNRSHQIIIKAGDETIVKFEYHQINGQSLVKIRQNNLLLNTFGSSAFFKKDEIDTLFGNSFKG
ncbi:hypothetical protein [Lutibacter sp.]|uniref:hypothetical protein n=1 Tax=Lutibacter sp. TaxID=1925666 RepID=UPI001A2637C3|nr:hypothetical protein [Lutibacter sp.]MBI9040234.1 hypothetical protein [Lutibacter sp.]